MIELLLALAGAPDTTDLFRQRQEELARIPFFCTVGRQPVASSVEALSVVPTSACRFQGPLDSVRDPLRLEPPFLDPRLAPEAVRAIVGAGPDGVFALDGERFQLAVVSDVALHDTLFHLRAHPPEWGTRFASIALPRADAATLLAARFPSLFWANPYFDAERSVLPRLLAANRQHRAVPLRSKCAPPGDRPGLLFVGDLHRVPDAEFFLSLVNANSFAFAALEVNTDRQPSLEAFLSATTPAAEEAPLADLTEPFPRELVPPFHAIFRALKARGTPIVLMDYARPYFNFPYTNTAFHGLPIATRNQLWVSRLPGSWEGTGVLFGGRDHFLDMPGADVQDFARERFPGASFAFVNPSEACTPPRP